MYKTAVFTSQYETTANADENIYVVPSGKVFLLTGFSVNVTYKAGTFADLGEFYIEAPTGWYNIMFESYGNDTAGTTSISQNINPIIPCIAGTSFDNYSGSANVKISTAIWGYSIDACEYNPAQ